MPVIFPPRPKGRIDPRDLQRYEDLGWLAQYKYNGSRNLIHIHDGKVEVYGREGDKHLSYSLPVKVAQEILALPGLSKGEEYWLDSELLSKTSAPETKNKIVLFDVLHAGKYLFMAPDQVGRLKMLADICGNPTQLDPWRGIAYQVSETVLMAPTFSSGFKTLFTQELGDEVEGLLLRKPTSVLDNFGTKYYEINWMIRCRKPHKNYNF